MWWIKTKNDREICSYFSLFLKRSTILKIKLDLIFPYFSLPPFHFLLPYIFYFVSNRNGASYLLFRSLGGTYATLLFSSIFVLFISQLAFFSLLFSFQFSFHLQFYFILFISVFNLIFIFFLYFLLFSGQLSTDKTLPSIWNKWYHLFLSFRSRLFLGCSRCNGIFDKTRK